jgi:hypothetical protein
MIEVATQRVSVTKVYYLQVSPIGQCMCNVPLPKVPTYLALLEYFDNEYHDVAQHESSSMVVSCFCRTGDARSCDRDLPGINQYRLKHLGPYRHPCYHLIILSLLSNARNQADVFCHRSLKTVKVFKE